MKPADAADRGSRINRPCAFWGDGLFVATRCGHLYSQECSLRYILFVSRGGFLVRNPLGILCHKGWCTGWYLQRTEGWVWKSGISFGGFFLFDPPHSVWPNQGWGGVQASSASSQDLLPVELTWQHLWGEVLHWRGNWGPKCLMLVQDNNMCLGKHPKSQRLATDLPQALHAFVESSWTDWFICATVDYIPH